ncbi:ABC transporter permease [Paenibacillus sp. FSL R7-0333]|uniref:ABC transporter permease n=1 Tax=Paenibacillus sp. FSL R7-0333 TaxID=1926587 RepID=UPI00096E2A48|nr:ABC transporter permease [Paenibacillus sp. FSL R7-0333]
MRSYLDLVPLSAKVHKRQNRMSVFCIVLAVFLVTVIFGMADMFIRSQIMQARMESGNWHVAIRYLSDEDAKLIALRPEIKVSSWYGVLNYRGDQGYTVSGKNVVIMGSDPDWMTTMQTGLIQEGAFPKTDHEAMITGNAKTMLGLRIGDTISIDTPDGTTLGYTISGFLQNSSKNMQEDSYAVSLTTKEFRSIYPPTANDKRVNANSLFYVQLSDHAPIQTIIKDLKLQFGLADEQVSENTQLLGLLGKSGNDFMVQIYSSAAVLFVLVLLASILMIASSLNSNVAQRTEFYGLMRCIGATPKQVMRFVRKEALGWCKFAIPLGCFIGMVVIWILCAALRYLSPDYFIGLPALAISLPSLCAGIGVGLMTVLLAARSPARRASKVSPLTAVSGNANAAKPVRKAANTSFFRIDVALGLHHARSSRKNFVLMVSSFSLSIILFLAFSVTIDFMNHAIRPLKPWSPDLSIASPDRTLSIDSKLVKEMELNPAVKRAYGRMLAFNVPVTVNGQAKKVNLISYEKHQMKWAQKYELAGSVDRLQQEAYTGLLVYDLQTTASVGDTITLQMGKQAADLTIIGTLSSSPFTSDPGVGTLICSEDTFRQLTGQTNYTVVDLQLTKQATDAAVEEIHRSLDSTLTFSDKRLGNRSVVGSYYSFGLFIYGFMALIALITIFNIMNSLAMSVSSRMKQYGAFRAIGLSNRQLAKMIVTEALTYILTGSLCGGIAGLILNKLLYAKLVTFRWGEPWRIPHMELILILALVLFSAVLAVRGPLKRIGHMSIVGTISAK